MILQKMLIRLTCIAPFTLDSPVRDEDSREGRRKPVIDFGSVTSRRVSHYSVESLNATQTLSNNIGNQY